MGGQVALKREKGAARGHVSVGLRMSEAVDGRSEGFRVDSERKFVGRSHRGALLRLLAPSVTRPGDIRGSSPICPE